ncbi:hypothetical protein B0T21DRAFT_409197 [Apiosordaria backusii]|uniref:Ankyrin repeat protein n=1 Tax=Apiosordaria backusii TaxID=314023 RepID=A0AA40K1I1_9PEZI|nr:hypothetical protein B0T21DRAFT_409197 [Apiosordaria backusii]
MSVDIALEISSHFTTAHEHHKFALLSRGFHKLLNKKLYQFNVTKQRSSAAEWACRNGRAGTLRQLKEQGAKFDDYLIHTALEARGDGQIPVLSFLLENGVDVNYEV